MKLGNFDLFKLVNKNVDNDQTIYLDNIQNIYADHYMVEFEDNQQDVDIVL